MSSSASSSSSEEEDPSPNRKPPPIIFKNRELWKGIHKTLTEKDITIRRALNTSGGIRLYLDSSVDLRIITKMLDQDNIELTTHQLREDRNLEVIIRNVNQSFTKEEILDELKTIISAFSAFIE